MKAQPTRLLALLMLYIVLAVAACGGGADSSPVAAPPAVKAPATTIPPAAAATVKPAAAAAKAPTAAAACEDYFGFCVAAQATGAVSAAGAGGWASSSKTDCTALAAAGAARILELPNLLAAGEQQITVALTRIGAYTGPGTYALKAQASGDMPDAFPAIEVAGRTFSNGVGSTAAVTVAANGSGSIQATGLVEQASIQVANPNPNARIDFAMQWTCQQEK